MNYRTGVELIQKMLYNNLCYKFLKPENEEKKMNTKKTIITVLTVVLVTAFIIGCNIPLENANKINIDESVIQPASADNQSAPVEKIRIRLNVLNSDTNPRTVRPSGLPTGTADFDFFKLSILGSNSGPVALPDNSGGGSGPGDVDYGDYFNYASLGAFSIDLTSGQQYTFTLTGYKFTYVDGTADIYTEQAVGVGATPAPLSVAGTVNIALKEIVNGTAPGTFSWNVNTTFTDPVAGTSTSYGTATISLYTLSDTALISPLTQVSNINLLSNANNTATGISVPSGYYKMIITLTKTNYQTVYVQEIVHIFAGFTTTYAQALPALRSTLHKITYDYSTDTGYNSGTSTNLLSENLNHGAAFSTLTTLSSNKPVHSSPATNQFNQWYTVNTAGLLSSPLDTTGLALKPITLYAGWTTISQIQVTLNPTFAFTGQYDPNLLVAASSFDQTDTVINFTITVKNFGDYDTFTLYKDESATQIITSGVVADPENDTDLAITVSLAYSSANVNWWQIGDHVFYLVATNSSNPTKISDSIEYTLTCQ